VVVDCTPHAQYDGRQHEAFPFFQTSRRGDKLSSGRSRPFYALTSLECDEKEGNKIAASLCTGELMPPSGDRAPLVLRISGSAG